jgi:high-affinity nickel-transport protein
MAGMSLIDATDGVLMLGLYGWAFADPVRRLYYNLAVTGISVFVALLVGGIEVLGLIGDKLGPGGAFWDGIAAAASEFGILGYGIVVVFVLTWLVSLLIYRLRAPGKIGA